MNAHMAAFVVWNDDHADWGCRVLRENSDARTVRVHALNEKVSESALNAD